MCVKDFAHSHAVLGFNFETIYPHPCIRVEIINIPAVHALMARNPRITVVMARVSAWPSLSRAYGVETTAVFASFCTICIVFQVNKVEY